MADIVEKYIVAMETARTGPLESSVNSPDQVPTAIGLTHAFHEIGKGLQSQIRREENAEEINSDVVEIFKVLSRNKITEEDIKKGRHHVDERITRQAIGYGVLSGLACGSCADHD